jgi:hypothetical protein
MRRRRSNLSVSDRVIARAMMDWIQGEPAPPAPRGWRVQTDDGHLVYIRYDGAEVHRWVGEGCKLRMVDGRVVGGHRTRWETPLDAMARLGPIVWPHGGDDA